MFLSNISIGKRLAIVLGVIVALFLASSAVSVLKLRQLGVEITAWSRTTSRPSAPAPTGCATPPRACSAPPPSPRAATPA